jgi:chloramphenicol 3-O-phosphotransferase
MVILLNGAIASGKTTIGKLLADTLANQHTAVTRYDVEELLQETNPMLTWHDANEQLHDWLGARKALAEQANRDLTNGKVIIVSGPFFTRQELKGFLDYLAADAAVFLFTLHVPVEERIAREEIRKRNSTSVLFDQQALLVELPAPLGSIVENVSTPDMTVMTIGKLLTDNAGRLDRLQI